MKWDIWFCDLLYYYWVVNSSHFVNGFTIGGCAGGRAVRAIALPIFLQDATVTMTS